LAPPNRDIAALLSTRMLTKGLRRVVYVLALKTELEAGLGARGFSSVHFVLLHSLYCFFLLVCFEQNVGFSGIQGNVIVASEAEGGFLAGLRVS